MKEKAWFKDNREINLYARIPEDLLYDKEAPVHACRVYGTLDRHLNKRTGECFPGHRKISQKTGISRSQIQKALEYLALKNFIRIVPGEMGESNSYELMPVGNLQVGGVAPVEGHPKNEEVAPAKGQGGPTVGPGVALRGGHNQSSLIKANNHTPQGEFVEWFKDQYGKKYGKPYLDGKADYVKATEVLKLFKPETLRVLVFQGWDNKDEYIKTASMTVKGFCSIINRLSLPGAAKPKVVPGSPQDIGWLERQRRERAAGNG